MFRGYQPGRAEALTGTVRKALRRMLDECGGPAGAEVYLAWVHLAPDTWARRLRGETPWPDGDTTRRMSPTDLARSLDGRMDAARAWDERGRPTSAAPVPGTGRRANGRPSASELLDILAEMSTEPLEEVPLPDRPTLPGPNPSTSTPRHLVIDALP